MKLMNREEGVRTTIHNIIAVLPFADLRALKAAIRIA